MKNRRMQMMRCCLGINVFGASGKRLLAALSLFLLLLPVTATAQLSSDGAHWEKESLPYDVIYQWGFIWKRAATATLRLTPVSVKGEPGYRAQMEARTLPFADRLFRVRDTLVSVMQREELRPLYYAKIADEDKTYRKDEVKYRYQPGATGCVGDITLYRPKRNAVEYYTVVSPEMTYDMLSVFYYLRTIDFSSTPMYKRFNLNIFSGRHIEYLSIEYMGRTILKLGNKEFPAFRVKLHFSTDAGEKESDNITAWISEDDRRIPLQVEGKLAIGALKAVYTGD